MENESKEKRFRNHVIWIVEQIGTMGVLILVALFGSSDMLPEMVEEMREDPESVIVFLVIFGVLLLIVILRCLWRIRIWSKTWFTISDTTVVMERNTLNQKKNTMGIRNISNINLEQNLLERLTGTARLKLNTDSLSTADETDMMIVLEKKDAEKLKQFLLERMDSEHAVGDVSAEQEKCVWETDRTEQPARTAAIGHAEYTVSTTLKNQLFHGLLSINLLTVLILVGTFAEIADTVDDVLNEGAFGVLLLQGGVIFLVFLGAFKSILGGFVRYYGFRIERIGKELHIQYGLFTQTEYTIPVRRINALKIRQSTIARVCGYYMAEIVNVGISDEDTEEKSFLLLYGKRDRIQEQLDGILPEFSEGFRQETERQPLSSWFAGLFSMVVTVLFIGAAGAGVYEFFPEFVRWIAAAEVLFPALYLLYRFLDYRTCALGMGEHFFVLVDGHFGRTFTVLTYDKIQYAEISQNFLAKKCRIAKGDLYILASAGENMQSIPYFPQEKTEELKRRILA
ncbi:MAG: PH domain-containing protein [Lachnospiraceae bacterium]|nr:PH domain-containing protein [Lachnospiraceae bacterium]